jgi:hypothetical protein
MSSNVKVCTPSEIYKLLPCGCRGLAKTCKYTVSFLKKMVVNTYACHVLSIFNCMPQHYIHIIYCYKTFHYKRYTKYILFITMLPYRITPNHGITLTEKFPNMEREESL